MSRRDALAMQLEYLFAIPLCLHRLPGLMTVLFSRRFGLDICTELNEKYNTACTEIRSLGLAHSAAERLANLVLGWCSKNGNSNQREPRVTMALTHEQIGQMIGTSRETVTRLFADLKKRQIAYANGSTLIILNKEALTLLARPA